MTTSSVRVARLALLLGALCSLGWLAPAEGAPVEPLSYRLTIAPDASYMHFDGDLSIIFEAREPIEHVVLESAGLDIVSAARQGAGRVAFVVDERAQTVTFSFKRPLPAGKHTLDIRYSGDIGNRGPGLYRASFDHSPPNGDLFARLCCNGNARYLLPLIGDAAEKASIHLALVLPRGIDAVSVMRVAQRRPAADERVEVVFRPSPPISPDLFFFAAGNFSRHDVRAGPTDIGVVLPPELSAQSGYALAASRTAVAYLTDYLDRPFPLPKLDAVVLPGAPGGAIGSWGSIQYAARYLTVGEDRSSDEELLITTAIVAHETAHQWFANLVTPADRGHRWLSEGIAVWLENNFVSEHRPDWHYWLRANAYRDAAMRLDASGESHPVAYDEELMDGRAPANEIIYDKSAQILRMLENLVGEQAFRTVLQAYLDEHAYGNADTADFRKALETASLAQAAAVSRTYMSQAGVPLVDVLRSGCSDGSTTMLLRQAPLRDGSDHSGSALWTIPVTVAAVPAGGAPATVVMTGREASLHIDGCGPFKLNAGNVGYYRTRYDDDSFRNLRLVFGDLSTADQLGLLYDQFALAEAGYASFDDYLDLVGLTGVAPDPLLHLQWVRAVNSLDAQYKDHRAREAFRDAATRSLAALLDRLRWDAPDGEALNASPLRSELIETLARLGHAETIEEAQRRIAAVGIDADRLPRATREAVFKAAGTGLDERSAARHRRRAAASSDPFDQRCHWLGLASASNDETAAGVLEWLLTDPGIEPYLRHDAVVLLARSHTSLAFTYLESGAATIAEQLGNAGYVRLLADVARQSNDPRIAARLVRSVDERFPAELAVVKRAEKDIYRNSTVIGPRLPGPDTWSRFASANSP